MKAFGNYHPAVLITYFLSVLLTAMFASNPVFQLSALLGGALFYFFIKKSGKQTGSVLFYILMFFVITITNPLFSHNGATPLFFINGKAVTLEAFAYGAGLAATVIAVLIWFKCLNEIMTSDKILYLFSKAVPKLSLIVSMSIKFIPEFISQSKKVSRAQRTMGIYSSDSYAERVRSRGRVFASMVSWSLENSIDTSMSMKSRGYGIKGRTAFSLFKFQRRDVVMLVLCLSLLCITLAGYTEFYYYPRISRPEQTPLALASYIAFAILSFLPLIIEIREALVWKYCVSKV